MSPKRAPETYDGWLTKQEAAEALGVSQRKIERLASAREIEQRERHIPNRRPCPVFNPVDIQRLAEERANAQSFLAPTGERPMPASVALTAGFADAGQSIGRGLHELAASTSATSVALSAGLDKIADQLRPFQPPAVPIAQKLWLTLDEAQEYSGHPRAYLLSAIASGTLVALKSRAWRVRRTSLEVL